MLLDLDGTLVRSRYDWPAIRALLGVEAGSILDHVHGLPPAERRGKMAVLEEIEADATAGAEEMPGAAELLALLHARGLSVALVTNNSLANVRRLQERFGLCFDVVVSRDDGVWKPSAVPLVEALRRLGVAPEASVVVGDSVLDVRAGREAGCRWVFFVGTPDCEARRKADRVFADLGEVVRFLREAVPEEGGGGRGPGPDGGSGDGGGKNGMGSGAARGTHPGSGRGRNG